MEYFRTTWTALAAGLLALLAAYYFGLRLQKEEELCTIKTYRRILYSDKAAGIYVFEQHEEGTNILIRCLSPKQPQTDYDDCDFASRMHPVSTCVDMEHVHHQSIQYLRMLFGSLYLLDSVERVLIIGLGGGAFPMSLYAIADAPGLKQKLPLPLQVVDIVDIDESVVRVAGDWFGFQPSAATRVFVEDGATFLAKTPAETYDLIVVDAFDQEGRIPQPIASPQFVADLRRALRRRGGVAAINVNSDNNTKLEHGKFHERIRAEFGTSSEAADDGLSNVYELREGDSVVLLSVASDSKNLDAEADSPQVRGTRSRLEDIKARAEALRGQFDEIKIDTDWLVTKFTSASA